MSNGVYSSRKLKIGIAGLAVLGVEALLDSLLGLPNADGFIKATVVLGLGGVGTQGLIDLLKAWGEERQR